MKRSKVLYIRHTKGWRNFLLFGLGGVITWCLFSLIRPGAKEDALIAVDLGGMQHMGPAFNIAQFFLDGVNGFNVGRDGGGGSDVCCVLLPKKWRQGLSVDVRWGLNDWRKEIPSEIRAGNYDSITAGAVYKARVPVEKYDIAGRVVVHFFTGGKARVIVGSSGPRELLHAALPHDSHAADLATVGQPVRDMFTEAELTALRQQEEDHNKKYGGRWK